MNQLNRLLAWRSGTGIYLLIVGGVSVATLVTAYLVTPDHWTRFLVVPAILLLGYLGYWWRFVRTDLNR